MLSPGLSSHRPPQSVSLASTTERHAVSIVQGVGGHPVSRTAFDLQRVLETLLENAIRICGAMHGIIFRYDGECCRAAAAYNAPPGAMELWERSPIRAGRGTTVGRALLERRPIQIRDVQADPEYDFPEAQKLTGFRT